MAENSQTPLTLDAIANLLGDDSLRPKPRQIGPLKYTGKVLRCNSCQAPCMIEVGNIPYCTSHALYALNRLLIPDRYENNCTCEAGRKTMYSLHTSDCAAYGITDIDPIE